ncbi:MAG: hypothetical protein VXW87_03490 [Pseudomonadota bacterium]|nr:hypothetical protein [Pseudomonadota bacterium]
MASMVNKIFLFFFRSVTAESQVDILPSALVVKPTPPLSASGDSLTDMALYQFEREVSQREDDWFLNIYVGAQAQGGANVSGLHSVKNPVANSKKNISHFSKMTERALKLRDGDGVKKNTGMALVQLKIAAEGGNVDAMWHYAQMLSLSSSQAKVNTRWLRKLQKDGDTETMWHYSNINRSPQEIQRWYQKAAARGHVNAMFSYAECLYHGTAGYQNFTQARHLLLKAVDKGHTAAEYLYGVMLQNGEGGGQNGTQALQHFKNAAEKGHPAAIHNYAAFGFTDDTVQRKWLKVAIDSGSDYVETMIAYGFMLEKAIGGDKDLMGALDCYGKAFSKGGDSLVVDPKYQDHFKNSQLLNMMYYFHASWMYMISVLPVGLYIYSSKKSSHDGHEEEGVKAPIKSKKARCVKVAQFQPRDFFFNMSLSGIKWTSDCFLDLNAEQSPVLTINQKQVLLKIDIKQVLDRREYNHKLPISDANNQKLFEDVMDEISVCATAEISRLNQAISDYNPCRQGVSTTSIPVMIKNLYPEHQKFISEEVLFDEEIDKQYQDICIVLKSAELFIESTNGGFEAGTIYKKKPVEEILTEMKNMLDSLVAQKEKVMFERDQLILQRIRQLEDELHRLDFKGQRLVLQNYSEILKKRKINVEPLALFLESLQALKQASQQESSVEKEQMLNGYIEREKPFSEEILKYLYSKAKLIMDCQEKRALISERLLRDIGVVAKHGPQGDEVEKHIKKLEMDHIGLMKFTGFIALANKFRKSPGYVNKIKWIGMLNQQKNAYLKSEHLHKPEKKQKAHYLSSPCLTSDISAAAGSKPDSSIDVITMDDHEVLECLNKRIRDFCELSESEELRRASRALVSHYIGVLHFIQPYNQKIRDLHNILGHHIQFDDRLAFGLLKTINGIERSKVIAVLSKKLESICNIELEDMRQVTWHSLEESGEAVVEKIAGLIEFLRKPLPKVKSPVQYYQKRDALFTLKVLFETRRQSKKSIYVRIAQLLPISQIAAEEDIKKYVEIRNEYRHQDSVMRRFNEDYEALQSALCDEKPLAIEHKL